MRPDPALGLTLLIAKGLFLLVGLRPGSWVVLSLRSHADTAEEEPNQGGRSRGAEEDCILGTRIPTLAALVPVSFSVTLPESP